ncbi:MAG TPA: hypothetical protein VH331_15730 [Allosphingosinicella sp.]|jgi:hypothetical protein|nr:hypothetical protein [Allosphingosinicella sp.]
MLASRPLVLSAILCLSACHVDRGHGADSDVVDNSQTVSAEGRAKAGTISVKAPGVDISISVPKELSGQARVGKDSKVLYPGSTLGGMAIAAADKDNQGGDTDVEIRFQTTDSPDKVAAWYRDPARAEGFKLKSDRKDGSNYVFTGIEQHEQHPFKLSLGPGPGGGTEGRLRVHHDD